MSRIQLVRLSAALIVTAACLGSVSAHGRVVSPAVSGYPVDCVDGQAPPSAARESLRRLSKAEFARTIRDLIGADVADALPALAGLIAGIPDDDMTGGFSNINWSLSADHVSGYLGVANEIGVQVGGQDALRRKVLPCAEAPEHLNRQCLDLFIETFVSRAYRRPLEPREKDELVHFHATNEKRAPADGLSALITRVLMTPAFLFKQGAGPVRSAVTCAEWAADESFARASRMSYGIWGTMPDPALFASAKANDLLDDVKLTRELRRMLRDGKARQWVRTFFRQWLHYEQMPVEAYSWPFLGAIDRAHLHDNAVDELDRFIEGIVWTDRGNYRDLMTSRKVTTASPALRTIYGMPVKPLRETELAPASRAGLMTRVAMLAHGVDEASVVKRGALIRRQLLCDALSQPDPALLPPGSLVPPEKNIHQTTRQRWEARTAPTICQGCHRMINPLGFALEAYDGIGRFRSVEKQPIPDSSPQAYTELKIDAAVVPFVESRTEALINGPVALSAFLGDSPKANFCFVKQLTKFVSGQPVDNGDLASLQALSNAMMQPGGSVQGVLVGVAKLHVTRE